MAHPDIIVVGAGSAGCALAGRLAASAQCRVLLLEAGRGNRHPLITAPIGWPIAALKTRFGWGYKAEPDDRLGGRSLDMPRGRLMGGTASINGMMYTRGQRQDYDGWAASGLTGWGYDEVLPYFRRSESNWRGASIWHGEHGPVRVSSNGRIAHVYDALLEAARELGYPENDDFNGERQAGFGMPDFTVRRARRESSATGYLALPQVDRNLTVRRGVEVLRIVIEGGRATGVEILDNGRRETLHAAEIVLSAGVFNSPHLLMLSGVGEPAALARHGIGQAAALPAVGANLQDHPMLLMAYSAVTSLGFEERLRLDRLLGSTLAWISGRSGLFDEAPLGIQGFVNRTDPSGRPDAQFQVVRGSPMSRPWAPGWRSPSSETIGAGMLQLDPSGRGDVTLRSADPRERPSVRLNFLSTDHDRQAARDMFGFMRRFFATKALRGLVGSELVPGVAVTGADQIDQFIASSIVSGAHQVGTCAMGTDPSLSVVDAQLRVHGIAGLRVADASVMPTIVRGNTSAPAMMIGEKAADLILGEERATPRPATAEQDEIGLRQFEAYP